MPLTPATVVRNMICVHCGNPKGEHVSVPRMNRKCVFQPTDYQPFTIAALDAFLAALPMNRVEHASFPRYEITTVECVLNKGSAEENVVCMLSFYAEGWGRMEEVYCYFRSWG